ncbi:MAG: Lrp/AsnC family transcriptional regulator [Paracoccaceae bacterium]
MLDDVDRRILRQWQAAPSLSPAELADRAGVSGAQVSRRLARLQDQGVIEAVAWDVGWVALGYSVQVSLRVTLDKTAPRAFDEFIAAAQKIPEVLEIQTFLGRVDVRLNLIARDMADYQMIYRDRVLTLPHLADIEALMQVARIKSDETVPL